MHVARMHASPAGQGSEAEQEPPKPATFHWKQAVEPSAVAPQEQAAFPSHAEGNEAHALAAVQVPPLTAAAPPVLNFMLAATIGAA